MSTHETEWQFDAVDLRTVSRALAERSADGDALQVVPDGTVTQTDLYLDTEDHRLHRAGYALRIRRLGRRKGGEATLKSLEASAPGGGVRDRREIGQELPNAVPAELLGAEGPVSERVRAVAGRKPLLSLFTVRTRRTSFALALGGQHAGVVALDDSRIAPTTSSSTTRLRRVEVEVDASAIEALTPFVDELRTQNALQSATLSKYEAGLLVADLKPAAPNGFGPMLAGDDDASIWSVALAVVRRQFAELLAHEPGTRLGDDIEELHDMRVASRRLRAALSLFDEVLPQRVLQLQDEIRWIGGMLGDVRDLDVQLEQLAAWRGVVDPEEVAALEPLHELLDAQRAAARARLLTALDSRRYESFVDRFGRALRARPPRQGGAWSRPAVEAAPILIQERFRAFRKAAARIDPDARPADYHRLRIRGKRLRYALEFFADLYAGETRAVVKRLVALQDLLGAHQDADVAIARLRRLATDVDHPLDPATVFTMGEIAERYRRRMLEGRRRVPGAYDKVVGKSWKAFSKVMERLRESAADRDDVTPV